MTTVSQPAVSEVPGRAPEGRRRGSARVREDRRTGYALIAPTGVIVLVMVVLPILWTVSLAFQHVRLINLRQTGFFGRYTADNFVAVLTSPGFGTALLARVVGEKKAREIWYLCRRYSAQEALAMGLVNAVVPHDELDAEVRRVVDMLLLGAPGALAATKQLLRGPSARSMADDLAAMTALSAERFASEEGQEGIRAFAEKRRPAWVPS